MLSYIFLHLLFLWDHEFWRRWAHWVVLSAESRSEFLEKLQRARSQVKPATASQPILSMVGPTKLTVGNWSLTCLKEGEIAIHNSDGQQATILKEDLPGFVFESNRGTKHSFTAETSLG